MANLIGIVDSVEERRKQYIASLKPHLRAFDWLRYGEKDFGKATLAWAAISSAPISTSQSFDGAMCFVLGNLSRESKTEVNDAECILQLSKDQGAMSVSGQNGYYVSCLLEPSGTVSIGTDILGLFPLYYYSTGTFLLFSTTPSLFRYFPKFTPELNPRGLAGVLLTMHITGGQTIWKGVRRLSVGHMLKWQEGEGAKEIKAKMLKASFDHFGYSHEEHIETFDRLLRKTVQREAAGRPISVLLSGGLDSRLIAGYLNEVDGAEATAVTFGDEDDYEMRCASKVTRTLKWPQVRLKVDFSSFRDFAWKLVDFEQLSNGFNDLAFFQGVETLHKVGPCILTGFLGDAVMGGSHIRWGYSKEKNEYTFESMLKSINKYGLPPDHINKLVNPELLGDCLEEVIEGLRDIYHSFEGLSFQRPLNFDLLHRQRFHVASVAWRTSFGAWPLMPYADREILEASFGMPAASVLDRRAQINLLCSHFPALAALPLDRNSKDTSPLIVSFYHKLITRLSKVSDFQYRKYKVKQLLGIPEFERRYYYRVFDINNPGWLAVRREAEQFRPKAEEIFNPAVLRELLPPPDVPIHVHDGIVDASSRKTLLGLMLWAGRNL